MSTLECHIDALDKATSVVFLKGSADIAAHDYFRGEITKVIALSTPSIVLDLRKLDFLTSLAVGEMLVLAKSKKASKGKVAIAGPNPYVEGVFAAAKLNAIIPIFKTVDEAVAACKG